MKSIFPMIEYPELFFAVVAPVGVDLNEATRPLERELRKKGYNVVNIRVTAYFSELSKDIPPLKTLSTVTEYDRVKSYISYGNQIRQDLRSDSALALAAIAQIVEFREIKKLEEKDIYRKNAYIIRQFKRKEEIDLLRSVYGRLLFQVSIYSRRPSRVSSLSKIFCESENSGENELFRDKAEEVIAIDENERSDKHGQRVQKIFHDADLIVNTDIANPHPRDQIKRFIELLFGSNSISPNRQEYGMFLAKAAALRTLDLSRQVGAAIFSCDGENISLGSNEVPKGGGGTYWAEDSPYDAREHVIGYDSNEKRKKELAREFYTKLFVESTYHEKQIEKKLDDLQFMDALEYGRIVHAEMSAILDAARLGRSTKNSVLYCTTFPCHMCAKHIVGAGIKQVVYLEPYPKSLAANLHKDSLEIDKADRGKYSEFPKTEFLHFYGITPRRYRELFERGKRKGDDGKFMEYKDGEYRPNIDYHFEFYTISETRSVQFLLNAIKDYKAKPKHGQLYSDYQI